MSPVSKRFFLAISAKTGEAMDTANDRNTVLVTPSTMALETLLRESKRLQAISEQLIRESRKLRTICMLIHQTYTYQHNHHKKYHLIALIIVEQE